MEAITKRADNYSKWYNELIVKSGLAENSGVRGCMVIKPYGYAIWENIQAQLDKRFKDTGHVNAYFPLFIPKSYFSKEANHVDGFAKECAVVTHYRLVNDETNGGVIVDPEAKLDEELIIRPTSETIIWDTYRRWIKSYRDLPILVNQWANVVRWEMRTRLFLRTAEFLWQEGHTAHASKIEAIEEAERMLDVYSDFIETYMAIPVIKGTKSESERFAGAQETYCVEALMQDGKALQAGTSHFLGQNFAKAFNVKFTNKTGKLDYVWATSWGVSTRLMGALVMAHSDDMGLIIPPKLAPYQVLIIPIYEKGELNSSVEILCKTLIEKLKNSDIRVHYDPRDYYSPGWKFNEFDLQGIPIRISIGNKEVENNIFEIHRRDMSSIETINLTDFEIEIKNLLEKIQENLYNRAFSFRAKNTTIVETYVEFKQVMKSQGGFILAHWDGTLETEERIKRETKATIRCIPLDQNAEKGKCVVTGKLSQRRVVFAKAY